MNTTWIGWVVAVILIAFLVLGVMLGGSELLNPQTTRIKVDAANAEATRAQQVLDQQLANLAEEHDARMALLQTTVPRREEAKSNAIEFIAIGIGLGITIMMTCVGLALAVRISRQAPSATPATSAANRPRQQPEFG